MSSRAWLRVAVSSALVLASFAPPLSAQQPESIPTELASALVGWRPSEPLTFHVGEEPPGFEMEWPAGTRVLGGVVREGGRIMVAAVVPAEPAEAWEDLQGILEAGEWVRAPTWPTGGGFTSAAQDPHPGFCLGEERHRTAAPGKHPSGGTLVVIRDSPGERTICDDSRRARHHPLYDDVLPALRVPIGSRMMGGSSGGSNETVVHSSARLQSDLDLDALLDSFGSQLEEAGWSPVSREVVGDLGVVTWGLEYEGEPWEGYLVAGSAPSGNAHHLYLAAWNPERED